VVPETPEGVPTTYGAAVIRLLWGFPKWLRNTAILIVAAFVVMGGAFSLLPERSKQELVEWLRNRTRSHPTKSAVLPPGRSDHSLPRAAAVPRIVIQKPPSPAGGAIAGTVLNVDDPGGFQIVVYALQDRWYVQPEADERAFLTIQADGSWRGWSNPGSKYIAVLVRGSYSLVPISDQPPLTGPAVVAATEVEAAKAAKEE
jgi:hypothetical protein